MRTSVSMVALHMEALLLLLLDKQAIGLSSLMSCLCCVVGHATNRPVPINHATGSSICHHFSLSPFTHKGRLEPKPLSVTKLYKQR